MINRDVYALVLAAGMGLAALAVAAWDRHERQLGQLRRNVDTVTRAVLAMPHGDSRVDHEEQAALRDWSRRDADDIPWPGVVRHSSMDRRPSEGGVR